MDDKAIREPMSPTENLIAAMEDIDEVTHAVAVRALRDGSVEVISGYLPDWIVVGLLRQALRGYENASLDSEEIGDEG